MWLEIDGDLIVGVHAQCCTSLFQWIEYGGSAKPGDRWDGENVLPRRDAVDAANAQRAAVHAHIIAVYPLWKQLNILREGNASDVATMGRFIDACRAWSNNDNVSRDKLNEILP